MSVPSLRTETPTSTLNDDDFSLIVNDSSETTVSTQTSQSWHSIVSDHPIRSTPLIRFPTIYQWLDRCSIEPDIRLTTAQEWKLRICLRRFLALVHQPLRILCSPSLTSNSRFKFNDKKLEFLGLIFHSLASNNLLVQDFQVKLIEFYEKNESNTDRIPLTMIKEPKLHFDLSAHLLKLALRSQQTLLELYFSTRENQSIRGVYYKWNELENQHERFDVTLQIDVSLSNDFN